MRPFAYERATDLSAVLKAAASTNGATRSTDKTSAEQRGATAFLAGGTTLVDLMKLDVMRPKSLIDINPLERSNLGRIDITPQEVRIGALVRMSEAADHAQIRRQLPLLAQSLDLAASQQIRHMASLGGNVLQRTRCPYFRDTSYPNCNKRHPGSGCAALQGVNRQHAVLGASDQCIATYPGDFAQALIALGAKVTLASAQGNRAIAFDQLHRRPSDTPDVETSLRPGELITGFSVALAPWMRRSLYLKIRDRESYEFALASAAVALDLDGGVVREARIGLGGVATVPWRAREAEAALKGQRVEKAAEAAAEAAFASAKPHEHNAFKVQLGKQTLVRALRQAATMEI